MRQIMTIIFIEGTLLFLLIALGSINTSSTSSVLLNNYEQQIFAPWPTAPPLPALPTINGTGNCAWYDASCIVGKASQLAQAVLVGPLDVIGGAIVWMASLALSFLQRISAFGNLYLLLMNGPDLSSIPFIGPLISYAIAFTVLIYAITIIRGNPSGV